MLFDELTRIFVIQAWVGYIVAFFFIAPKPRLRYSFLFLTLVIGFSGNKIDYLGAGIMCGGLLLVYLQNNSNKIVRYIGQSCLLIYCLYLMAHQFPGFNNYLYLENEIIKPGSNSFTMYLNFDKPLVVLYLLFLSKINYFKTFNFNHLKIAVISSSSCALIIMTIGLISGVVSFNFTPANHLLAWSIKNLLFVCTSEEVLFRYYLFEILGYSKNNSPFKKYLIIVFSAILFGFAHWSGGWELVGLATIAGLFYAWSYSKTGNILTSILTHFSINLMHILFFNYPN